VIFDCPKCGAENGVPASTIEADGRVLKCRRCLDAFRVFPPDDDESLPKEWLKAGQVPGSTDPASEIWSLEAPNTRIDPMPPVKASGNESLNFDQDAVTPIGDTDEDFVNVTDAVTDSANPSAPKRRSTIEELNLQAIDESCAVIEPYSEHEDPSEASLSLPPETGGALAPSDELPPTQFEPASANKEKNARDFEAVRARLIMRWRNFPLALRVAIAVFPFAFIVGLIFGGGENVTAPADATPVRTAAKNVSADDAADGRTGKLSKNTKTIVIHPTPAPDPVALSEAPQAPELAFGFPADNLAPEGHLYVQSRRLRIRSRPSKSGKLIGRLNSGDMVRVYDEHETWSLIFIKTTGPVGFVKTKYLDARAPVTFLAKAYAASVCTSVRGESVEQCLEAAKTFESDCLVPCGPPSSMEIPAVRCRRICAQAFDDCARSCRSKKKSRRRRGR